MTGIASITILTHKGKVIISKKYREDVPEKSIEIFRNDILENGATNLKPVFVKDGVSFCWISTKHTLIVSISRGDVDALMSLCFLRRLAAVFTDYFHKLSEESVKDNFVLAYELLDEVMVNGHPQITDPKILREYITTDAHLLSVKELKKPPPSLTNAVSWRPEGVKHLKNEIYLDVIEKLSMVLSPDGQALRATINGFLKVKSLLSGMPELRLGLNDKLGDNNLTGRPRILEMEDIKFHQCVRLGPYETDKTISFIPPDGEFLLMTYRLPAPTVKPLFTVETVVDPDTGGRKIEFLVKLKSVFKQKSFSNLMEVLIPVPPGIDTPQFLSATGVAQYVPARDLVIWKIKQMQGEKELILTCTFGLPPSCIADGGIDTFTCRPIEIIFEIPYFTVSGITVKFLKVTDKSGYKALPWVRYITQNGEYQHKIT